MKTNNMQLTGNAHKYAVFNIYTNHLDRNLLHKHKTVKLTRWENDTIQSISKCAEQTKKRRKIALPQITAHVF